MINYQCDCFEQMPGKLLNPNDYDASNGSRDATLQKFEFAMAPKISEV